MTVAFFTISQQNPKLVSLIVLKMQSSGHVDDAVDRFKDDTFVDGIHKKASTFSWSSDSIHYVDGGVSIVKKDGQKFVQLGTDFKAGLAPDLYIYLAPGHITF